MNSQAKLLNRIQSLIEPLAGEIAQHFPGQGVAFIDGQTYTFAYEADMPSVNPTVVQIEDGQPVDDPELTQADLDAACGDLVPIGAPVQVGQGDGEASDDQDDVDASTPPADIPAAPAKRTRKTAQ